MSSPRTGIWFIGARGGVAATATVGLLALQKGLTQTTGLVSALERFEGIDFCPWNSLIVGGHEIREGTLAEAVDRLHTDSRVFDRATLDACESELQEVDSRIRWGSLANCGPTISSLAGAGLEQFASETPTAAIQRLQRDLREFQQTTGVERVVVVNLSSTEPANASLKLPESWQELEKQISRNTCDIPASSLYAIAALDLGMAYVNFTPSLGAAPPAIQQLAELRSTCHAGQDGKTGETLLKSVLAPMFAARNLEVMSWVGHNIFGNLDGIVLDNPANKAAKVKNKDQLVGSILGYQPQSLISIEYIRSLGDWKTAWDHIHFRGFLGTPMTLQLTWQGCDSLLAAPLVLDLVRFVELSRRRGEVGLLSHLGSFFKRPLGLEDHDFSRQFSLLCDWAEQQKTARREGEKKGNQE
jgi:myo-inositol-1-phosphate synthase